MRALIRSLATRKEALSFIMAVLFFLAFFQLNFFPYEFDGNRADIISMWVNVAYLAPLFPVLIIVIRRVVRRSFPLYVVIGGGILIFVLGFLTTVFYWALTNGRSLPFVHGSIIMIAIISWWVFCFSESSLVLLRRLAYYFMLFVTVFSVLSLVTPAVVIAQSRYIAKGNPFCVGEHGSGQSVSSISDLRLFSFYTTKSGYKLNSNWYFHGVLIVEQPSRYLEFYNWSVRTLTFEEVHNNSRLVVSVRGSCWPRSDFWSSVPWVGQPSQKSSVRETL